MVGYRSNRAGLVALAGLFCVVGLCSVVPTGVQVGYGSQGAGGTGFPAAALGEYVAGDTTPTCVTPPIPGTAITVAASDTPSQLLTSAHFFCDGKDDEAEINSALAQVNASGGGLVYLLPGTYNICDGVNIRDGYANIRLQGSGPATLLRKAPVVGTMVGTAVAGSGYWTVTATTGVFHSGMLNHILQFDATSGTYAIKKIVSPTQVQIGYASHVQLRDAAVETSGDTFRVASTKSVVNQVGAGHHIWVTDLQIDGVDFGYNKHSGNKCLFINGNVADYTQCHHVWVERIVAHNATAEAICIDYAQDVHIWDCHSYNSAWAGMTLAQTARGSILRCHSDNCGTAYPSGSLGAGINCQSSEFAVVANNHVTNSGRVGIYVSSGVGNYASQGCIVAQNQIMNVKGGAAAICVDRSGPQATNVLDCQVVHNQVDHHEFATIGIYVRRAERPYIHGNRLLGAGSVYGIYLHGDSIAAAVEGNTITNYGAAIMDKSNGTAIIGPNY